MTHDRHTVTRVLKRLLCLLAGHVWGEWVYLSLDACMQSRVCERCGRFSSSDRRLLHVWSEAAYVSEGSCEQVKLCHRCGSEDRAARRITHAFGDFEYTSS